MKSSASGSGFSTGGPGVCMQLKGHEARDGVGLGKALKIARASSAVLGKPVSFPPTPPVVDRYQTPYVIDPLEVPIETKLNLLLAADAILRKGKKVKLSEAFMGSYRTEKSFASTEGSWIEQVIVECGAGMTATAIEGDEIQVRSYPNSFRGILPPRVRVCGSLDASGSCRACG